MKFEGMGIEHVSADLNKVDFVMESEGFVRADQWDYERVTYDRKFSMVEGTFYLRVSGYAIEGDVGSGKAIIQLLTPLLGKHYYPHGVEYGDGEQFPTSLVQSSQKTLQRLKEKLEAITAEA
ncbi:YugN family protein [Bacillus sp. NPDC077027]|uniref:YugN family protein n=1 Tax=Bacillus sp. NPDC077027 TaxID=3390548 RepID=UPI003D02016F